MEHFSPTLPAIDAVSSPSARVLFWRARFLRESAFLWHVPFLFWLVETTRPNRFVELGVVDAVSYFAACQALDKLNDRARCHGVFTGRDKDGSDRLPRHIEQRNEELYSELSALAPGNVETAAKAFTDGSIDLLLVNSTIDPAIFEGLVKRWLPKLSEHGILLLHGIDKFLLDDKSHKFADELLTKYPAIRLESGHGLAAVLYGSDCNETLLKLATESASEAAGYADLFHAFARLGATQHYEWASKRDAEKAKTAIQKLSEVEVENSSLHSDLEKRNIAYDERTKRAASLQAELFEAKNNLNSQSEQVIQLQTELRTAKKRYEDDVVGVGETASNLRQQLDTRTHQVEALEEQLTRQKLELVTLVDELRGQVEHQQQTIDALRQKLGQQEAAAEAFEAACRIAEDRLEAQTEEYETAVAKLNRAELSTETLSGQLESRFGELALLTKHLETSEAENAATIRDLRRQLAENASDVSASKDASKQQASDASKQAEKLRLQLAAKEAEVRAYEKKEKASSKIIMKLQGEAEELGKKIQSLRKQLSKADSSIVKANNQLMLAQESKDKLKESVSWKITAPVRSVGRMVDGLKGRS